MYNYCKFYELYGHVGTLLGLTSMFLKKHAQVGRAKACFISLMENLPLTLQQERAKTLKKKKIKKKELLFHFSFFLFFVLL